MSRIIIVAATTKDRRSFAPTCLGQALPRLSWDTRIEPAVVFENRTGLPAIFNAHLVESHKDDLVVFTHDDVFINDFWMGDRLHEALAKFDIVGVAGNKRRAPRQPAWFLVNDAPFTWDRMENLSGLVCHFEPAGERISAYGPAPATCQLLDGLFLAVRVAALLDRKVRFDEQFPFHFYDLDFCRTAVNAGLRLGTWPIAVSHASGGNFGALEWQRSRDLYYRKWGE